MKKSYQQAARSKNQSQTNKTKKKLVVAGGRAVQARVSGELNRLNPHAAGVDIGGERHYVAVPPGSTEHPVREFGVFTKDLYAMADWLKACGVETVAMESTGVYWVPLFEVLEERGFKVKLADARKVKNVSGRKSDVLDCQWLQQLESYGLLQAAYRPADEGSVSPSEWCPCRLETTGNFADSGMERIHQYSGSPGSCHRPTARRGQGQP